jgi:hypothetical protein
MDEKRLERLAIAHALRRAHPLGTALARSKSMAIAGPIQKTRWTLSAGRQRAARLAGPITTIRKGGLRGN